MELVQAKLVRAVISPETYYGFELPSSDRFMFQALGKQERHHLCPTSFENLKNLECQPSADIASKLYPRIWRQRRKMVSFRRGTVQRERAASTWGAPGSRNHQRSMCRMAWRLSPATFCSTKTVWPRENESKSHLALRSCNTWFMDY